MKKAASRLCGLLATLVENGGATLVAVASKGEPVRVPPKI